MDPGVFLEKVRRPASRGLVRERLERRTAALAGRGADAAPLLLVLGPPGSGKTTLLSHIAESSSDPAAWYRVGTEDDDERALTRHLGHALASAVGEPNLVEASSGGRVADLVCVLDDPALRPVQLIVDDVHEIAGTPAERALERFLSLRPRKVRMTVGSRRPPLINISRMLVSGELTQLDGEDLRFRSWEVEQLFRAVYDAPLSPEAAAALTRRTGGWAAGLQLFHLATAQLGRAERERAVDELSGRSRLIRSYLARNVLGGLDPDRRRFLLLTSAVGVLTGDICDALLDRRGSAAVLSELEQEQFFTTSTDGGLTYQYHQVLQTHLEVLLVDELGSQSARELYSRGARLLEQAGHVAAAIRAHARAEDWGSVARLLKPDSAIVGGDDDLWGMLSLPGAPVDDPGLVLAGARRLARDGQIAEAVAAFRKAEELLDDPAFRRRCAVERSTAAVWLPQAPVPVAPAQSDSDSGATTLRLSVELRQLTRGLRAPDGSQGPLVRGLALLLQGDLIAAARQLRAARVEQQPGAAPGTPWGPLAARLGGLIVDLLLDPDEVVAGQVEEIMLNADVQGWPWLSRIARGLQAAMLIAAAPAAWRSAAAAELLDDLEQRGDRWTVCLTSLAIGAAYAWIDQPALASRALQRTDEIAAELGAPVLRAWAGVLLAALAARQGVATADIQAAIVLRTAAGLGLTRAPEVATLITQRRRGVAGGSGVESSSSAPDPGGLPPVVEPSAPVGTGVVLSCLGGFSLSSGGVEVPWRELRPRVHALLMLLAMKHGRQVHREELVDALWPDATLASGIRSLQVAVSSIRHCLAVGGVAEDALRRYGDAYALQIPAVTDLLADFRRLAQAAGRERGAQALGSRLAALELYTGELLPEAGPAEWVVEERARLRQLAAAVGFRAAQDALAAGELATALDAARRSVALDPYHDPSWQVLVDINERLGDHSAAVIARREQTLVWADLGLADPERRPVLPQRPERAGDRLRLQPQGGQRLAVADADQP